MMENKERIVQYKARAFCLDCHEEFQALLIVKSHDPLYPNCLEATGELSSLCQDHHANYPNKWLASDQHASFMVWVGKAEKYSELLGKMTVFSQVDHQSFYPEHKRLARFFFPHSFQK
jgi:hypothetical protein